MSTEETHLIHIPTGLTESEFPEMISISIICRLCANQSDKLIGIYSEDGVNNDLAGKMNLYLPVKVTETDNLPLQCCWQCASTILAWHDLVVTSVEADRRLKSYQFVSEKQLEEITSSYGGTDNILTENADEALEHKETKSTITSPDDDSSNTNPVQYSQSFVAAGAKATSEDTIIDKSDTSEPEENTEYTIVNKPKHVDGKNSITCNICERTFNSRIQFKTHLKTIIHSIKMPKVRRQRCDVTRNFKCSWCDKRYSKNHDLTRHLQAKHGQTNLTSSGRSKHKALLEACRITSEGDLYKCDICSKTFTKFSNLRRHRTIHSNVKAYGCSQCGKSFRLNMSLTKHISEVHNGTRRYQCEVCKKSFKNKWSHDEHLYIHTDFRPYICDICGKSFRQKAALYNHKRYHSTDLSHECNVCHKQFHRNQNLEIHYRMHTGQKPHCCGQCGAGFASKQALNRHKKRHESVRCDKCGCKFENIRYLKLHITSCKSSLKGLNSDVKTCHFSSVSEDGKNDGVIIKNIGFCGEREIP